MNNKLLFSFCDKGDKDINVELIIDTINKYGNNNIDGIEMSSLNVENIRKCAKLCRINNLIFRFHFPSQIIDEKDVIKYLKLLNEISNDLKYNINVVFHSLYDNDNNMEKNIINTIIYIGRILNYIKKYNLNITASLENLNMIDSIKRINISNIDSILKKFENLSFTYDIGHDIYDNNKPSKLSKLQVERINNVHIHSIVNKEDHYYIKESSIDLNEIKDALKNISNINYTDPIVLEYAIDFFNGNTKEEKIINYVKSFNFFKTILEHIN